MQIFYSWLEKEEFVIQNKDSTTNHIYFARSLHTELYKRLLLFIQRLKLIVCSWAKQVSIGSELLFHKL